MTFVLCLARVPAPRIPQPSCGNAILFRLAQPAALAPQEVILEQPTTIWVTQALHTRVVILRAEVSKTRTPGLRMMNLGATVLTRATEVFELSSSCH